MATVTLTVEYDYDAFTISEGDEDDAVEAIAEDIKRVFGASLIRVEQEAGPASFTLFEREEEDEDDDA